MVREQQDISTSECTTKSMQTWKISKLAHLSGTHPLEHLLQSIAALPLMITCSVSIMKKEYPLRLSTFSTL